RTARLVRRLRGTFTTTVQQFLCGMRFEIAVLDRGGHFVNRRLLAVSIAAMFLLGSVAVAQQKEKAERAQLYKSNCAMCHGADGSGNTPIGKKLGLKDLGSPEVQHLSDADLKQIIENGRTNGTAKMPPFKAKLKPEQVQDLVAH